MVHANDNEQGDDPICGINQCRTQGLATLQIKIEASDKDQACDQIACLTI